MQPWHGRQVAKVRWGHVLSKGALLSGALLLSMHYLRVAGPVRYQMAHPFTPVQTRRLLQEVLGVSGRTSAVLGCGA